MYRLVTARNEESKPEALARQIFGEVLNDKSCVDAIYSDSRKSRVIAVSGIPFQAPAACEITRDPVCEGFLKQLLGKSASVLIQIPCSGRIIRVFRYAEKLEEISIPEEIRHKIIGITSGLSEWAGFLNEYGEHEIDLKKPSPGPHFFINLLLGNRIGFPHALQTTPKSVVDRFGGGSFRAHAATLVLATRWDMRQEENGFPANRQFYLVEDSKKLFYSADTRDKNLISARCVHSRNSTVITYKTVCGLEIRRTIFILPQEPGLPIAVEAQRIEIRNNSNRSRKLKLVYTGMFGTSSPHALQEDVLYSNVIMQGGILLDDNGSVIAVCPDYYPEYAREDFRFHTMLVHKTGKVFYPDEYCTNYNEFVGNGSLENPQSISRLNCSLNRKGPGFFALAAEMAFQPWERVTYDNFTGLVSQKSNGEFNGFTLQKEIESLIKKYTNMQELGQALSKSKKFLDSYSGFIRVKSGDELFDAYFNNNLPFQVLYQTFVSRSFCQTQKGYREIGFREIQDLFASMYYFNGMGMKDLIKELLNEWCSKIFEFGYAFHNFFWEGKEPGKWSDDALWFIQAVSRYVRLTGDLEFLDEECEIAGDVGNKKRPVYDTIKAVLRYSCEISIGKHGMPLLDNADWNDCLKLDKDFANGPQKERLYYEQIELSGAFGEPFESNYSESVMNAFLAKLALDETVELAKLRGDNECAARFSALSGRLVDNIQKFAWKEDFFARVLFNRYNKDNGFSYLGAKGDGLSADPDINGTYFLNSFSWALLSDSAAEEQIEIMVNTIEAHLKTPYGLKLVTPANLGLISDDTATGHYFPGDRENGAVFKHASMMAAAAMLKSAKAVKNKELAAHLARLAYWMIDLILPYKTLENPYVLCGNPRFCTQYNNSETGENIGPMLSGTATWLMLSLMSGFGIEYTGSGIIIDPILRERSTSLEYKLNTGKALYMVKIQKPEGFFRVSDGLPEINLDGEELHKNIIPALADGLQHQVKITFRP